MYNAMKRPLLLSLLWLSVCLLPSGYLFAQADELWKEANEAYTAGDYPRAIALYDSIERQGYTSAPLFYNRGNAYFKTEQIGRAILYYSRAQRLDPGDADIRYNLSIECRNLTDERLYDNFSLQKAGRAFYAKLRVYFGN